LKALKFGDEPPPRPADVPVEVGEVVVTVVGEAVVVVVLVVGALANGAAVVEALAAGAVTVGAEVECTAPTLELVERLAALELRCAAAGREARQPARSTIRGIDLVYI
jgi:hypothetical protein